MGRDITEIALARERIASLAYSDPLTGLANRTSLMPALEQAVQRARRTNSKLAVVFLDLDGFKEINDAYGHDAGDALLVELAGRLRDNLRASDLIARLGGDEFLVVLEEVQDPSRSRSWRRSCWSRRCGPTPCRRRSASVTASIGISIFPDDAARRHRAHEARRHRHVRGQAGGQEHLQRSTPPDRRPTIRRAQARESGSS